MSKDETDETTDNREDEEYVDSKLLATDIVIALIAAKRLSSVKQVCTAFDEIHSTVRKSVRIEFVVVGPKTGQQKP